jgi:hypothetical protein
MDEDRQRLVAAWSVIALGFAGVAAMTLVVEGWETVPTLGAYLLCIGLATVAGALPLPGR